MRTVCTDLSGLLVVLVEEVVSPALDAGLHVAPGLCPASCAGPEVSRRGQRQRGDRAGQPRHGQTHLTAEHQTPGVIAQESRGKQG